MPNPSLHVPFELNTGRPTQIGLVVLQSDETIEQDMRRLIPSSAELLVSRVPSGAHVTPDSLAAMESELSRAAALFPLGAQCSTIGYGCTSGTAQIGSDRVAEMIRAGKPTPYVTEPVSALIAACHHLGLGRIGLLSPYIASVSERLRSVLLTEGIDVTAFASFNESAEDKVSLIAPSSIVSAARALAASAPMDGLFVSCTNLRTLGVIETLEEAIAKPVLSSNQVLAWHMLRLSEIQAQPAPFGRLWNGASSIETTEASAANR